MKRTLKQQRLKESGYAAAMAGKPCKAGTAREMERGAWEQGWRAGNRDRANTGAAVPTAAEDELERARR